MKSRVTPESVEAYLDGLPPKARTQVSRGKATLKFPLDQPVPLELVTAAVKFRKLAMLAAARKKAR